jgi:hypothetical protein
MLPVKQEVEQALQEDFAAGLIPYQTIPEYIRSIIYEHLRYRASCRACGIPIMTAQQVADAMIEINHLVKV